MSIKPKPSKWDFISGGSSFLNSVLKIQNIGYLMICENVFFSAFNTAIDNLTTVIWHPVLGSQVAPAFRLKISASASEMKT